MEVSDVTEIVFSFQRCSIWDAENLPRLVRKSFTLFFSIPLFWAFAHAHAQTTSIVLPLADKHQTLKCPRDRLVSCASLLTKGGRWIRNRKLTWKSHPRFRQKTRAHGRYKIKGKSEKKSRKCHILPHLPIRLSKSCACSCANLKYSNKLGSLRILFLPLDVAAM